MISWYKVRPFFKHNGDDDFGAKSEYENTFQILLVSDHTRSYVIYVYERLDWPDRIIDPSFQTGYEIYDEDNTIMNKFVFESKSVQNLLSYSNCGGNNPGVRVWSFENSNCRM